MIIIAFIAVLFIFPEVKLKLKDLFFPVAAIENAVTLQDSDMDIQLKGINAVSYTHLDVYKRQICNISFQIFKNLQRLIILKIGFFYRGSKEKFICFS